MQTDIGALARRVAAHLGGFTAVLGDDGACLRGPGDQELWLERMWHQDRVEIRGGYPPGEEAWDLASHEITVAIARGPQTIASEITRRLLPAYQQDLQVARDRIAQTARDSQQRTRRAAGLLTTIPGSRATDGKQDAAIHWYDSDAGGGTIRLTGDGSSSRIELYSARPELTRRIAEAVAADICRATGAVAGPAPRAH